MKRVDSSFRDPNGFIFEDKGIIYRQINLEYKMDYDKLMEPNGLYDELVSNKMLVAHQESSDDLMEKNANSLYKIIKPDIIPYISYPYEWTLQQYRDAATLTLDICLMAIKHGMILKDASSYNIQFVGGRPIFIDTLSFTKYEEGQIWEGYGQFCRHFLAPIVLMAEKSVELSQLMRVYIDGIPLDLASKLLPKKTKLNLPLYLHLHLHGKKQKDHKVSEKRHENSILPKTSLIAIVESLKSLVNRKAKKHEATEWGDYYEKMLNYSDKAFSSKYKIVEKYLLQTGAKTICDLGANKGEFSKIAGNISGTYVVAYDIDHTAVEKHFYTLKENNVANILPLVLDLTNPSPALGWANKERLSLQERSNWDCIMALALIHHLSISNNLPFAHIASYFADLTRYLIIEFVPKEDSQVQKLLLNRKDIFTKYTQETFEEEFSKYYTIIGKENVLESARTMYLMEKKKDT